MPKAKTKILLNEGTVLHSTDTLQKLRENFTMAQGRLDQILVAKCLTTKVTFSRKWWGGLEFHEEEGVKVVHLNSKRILYFHEL